MEGKNMSCKLLCMACLCVGRSLHEIRDNKLKQYYFETLKEMPPKNMVSNCPIVCWECEALLKKTMSFTEQVRDCYRTLQSYSIKSLDECLLTGVTRPPRLKVICNQPITISPDSVSNDKMEIHLVDIKDEVRNLWDDVIDLDIEESQNVQDWPVTDFMDNIIVEVDMQTGVQNIINKKRNKKTRVEKMPKRAGGQESSMSPEVTSYEIVKEIKQDNLDIEHLGQSNGTSSDESIEKYTKKGCEWSNKQEDGENRDYFLWTISDSRTCSESEASVSDSPSSCGNTEEHKLWTKSVMLIYHRLCTHKYSSLFRHPISDERAPLYSKVVKRPMDLGTIRRNIKTGRICTTAEFQRDVLMMVSNALVYNSSGDRIHEMAKDFHEEAKSQLNILLAAQAQAAPQRRKRRRLD